MSTTPIVQFGTSRFLQAHADLFVSEALASGEAVGPITVVQTSGDPSRAHRLKALVDPDGYEVRVKGLKDGERVETSCRVTSIRRALSLPGDLNTVSAIVCREARILISNTADAGFKPQVDDQKDTFSPSMSYPAKLTWLLFQRFLAGAVPIQIMPTELVPKNGDVLRDLVLQLAENYPPNFRPWLESSVIWVNSLVDRIVSEPLEPAGAVAEPYALWAIEDQPGLLLPCQHPDVQVVQDLDHVETLKLYVLNLGHTYLVSRWLAAGSSQVVFVRDLMEDDAFLADLQNLYQSEVVPGFAAHGRESEARAYVTTTIDRFKNPFLDHRLEDIAQNHDEKLQRRIGSFRSWVREAAPELKMPKLDALLKRTQKAGTA
ncbi:mannitol dehydrogenase family protein [Roseibium sp.]|uniref:mannitol dehydrogenase family protein n=1 Tax=Roseibium sp. TaxID=1936156 RepID=UPI0039F085C7